MFEDRPSPVIASEENTRKLPRLGLLALLFVFIVPGLITRDFWASDELTQFATTLAMTQGTFADWLLPNINGIAYYENGPLALWAAGICIKLFGGIVGADAAARLSILIWFSMTTAAIWYGTWYLARRPEAQPVVMAFGKSSNPIAFGRVVADAALLLFVATFGLCVYIREFTADVTLLATVSCFFFSLAFTCHRPKIGPVLTGLAIAMAVFASHFFMGVVLLVLAAELHARIHAFTTPYFKRVGVIALTALTAFIVWPQLAVGVAIETIDAWFAGWWNAQLSAFDVISNQRLKDTVADAVWFLWPLWPFTGLALYSFRKHLGRTHMKMPLTLFVGLIIANIVFETSVERFLMTLTPAMAVLAGFGLLTARRAWTNILDWFSASLFTLLLATLWTYFIAWNTNLLPKMLHSIEKLAPGVTPTHNFLVLFICIAATLAWLTFVIWRVNHHQKAAWKGPWLAAVGMTGFALLSIYLFGNAIDRAQGYKALMQEVKADLAPYGETACLNSQTLSDEQCVLFSYYGLALSEKACPLSFELATEKTTTKDVIKIYGRSRNSDDFVLKKN